MVAGRGMPRHAFPASASSDAASLGRSQPRVRRESATEPYCLVAVVDARARGRSSLVLRQNLTGSQVVDLSVMIRALSSSMITLMLRLLRLLPFLVGGHCQLALENLALRQQLDVYKRTMARPPYAELIGSSGSCSPESGPDGGGLS